MHAEGVREFHAVLQSRNFGNKECGLAFRNPENG